MRPWTAILCTLLYTTADLILTTFQHTNHSNGNLNQDHAFLKSLLDVVGASLLRGVLLGSGLVAVTNYGLSRRISLVSSLATVSFVCSLAGTYALVELLLHSDIEEAWDDAWFWRLLIGTSTSYIAALCFWWLPHLKAPGLEHQGADAKGRLKSGDSHDGTPDTKQATTSPSVATVAKLLTHCKPDAALIAFAFFFLVGSTTADIFSPYYAGLVVDGIVVQKSLAQVADSMGFLTIVSLGCAFSIGARVYLFSTAYTRLNLRIRHSLFDALLSQEIGFFDENHTGDIISRLIADTAKMSDVITENVNVLLRSVVKIIGIVIIMFRISWQLSLITILGFPIILLVSKAYGNYYKKLAERVQSAYAEANNIAVEVISAMKTVRSFANEETESRLYREKLDKVNVFRKKEVLASTFFTWSAGLAQLVLQFSVVCYGAHLVISNQMSSGNLVSFIVYVFLLGDCIRDINYVHAALMQGVGAAEKVFQFLERKPLMVYDGTLAPDHLEGEVEFKDVTFAYPTRPSVRVLKNVSFKLHPGKVTALVGPSGSGKSSCVNILEHFYPLQEGEVLLDGHPISRYDHKYLRRKVALVSQEPVLFSRSIRSNILYGLDTSPNRSVVEAAEKANAHMFVSELPEGYNTEAGEKGAQLSGGQKQRVAIARALIRNPKVLILDEATSALDAESEHVIQQALSSGLHGQTVLVVAHRLNTVEKAHHIIVLDKGQVVQQGTHTKLMEEGGLYSMLVQRQFIVQDGRAEDIEETVLPSP